jgi:hypothetical protein
LFQTFANDCLGARGSAEFVGSIRRSSLGRLNDRAIEEGRNDGPHPDADPAIPQQFTLKRGSQGRIEPHRSFLID